MGTLFVRSKINFRDENISTVYSTYYFVPTRETEYLKTNDFSRESYENKRTLTMYNVCVRARIFSSVTEKYEKKKETFLIYFCFCLITRRELEKFHL